MKKSIYSMHKQLLRILHHLRIFLEQHLPQPDLTLQPRIDLINLPIQNKRVDNAKGQFDSHPKVVAARVPGTGHLDEGLDDGSGLEIGGNDVVLLVGTQQGLLVVGKVTDEGGSEEREVGKVDNAHLELRAGEYQRQEAGQYGPRAQDDKAYPTIQVAEYGDNFIDFAFVVLEQGLVEHVTDGTAYAQFGQVEETQEVLQGAGQSHEVCSQGIQEYLPGEE